MMARRAWISAAGCLVLGLLAWALRPSVHRPQLDNLFPKDVEFESHVPEVVLDNAVLPTFHGLGRALLWFRLLQQGNVHIYLTYIFVMIVVLLVFG